MWLCITAISCSRALVYVYVHAPFGHCRQLHCCSQHSCTRAGAAPGARTAAPGFRQVAWVGAAILSNFEIQSSNRRVSVYESVQGPARFRQSSSGCLRRKMLSRSPPYSHIVTVLKAVTRYLKTVTRLLRFTNHDCAAPRAGCAHRRTEFQILPHRCNYGSQLMMTSHSTCACCELWRFRSRCLRQMLNWPMSVSCDSHQLIILTRQH